MDTIDPSIPCIDEFLFERQFERFRKHVLDQSGRELNSFTSNSYTEKEEGYKYDVYRDAREILSFEKWREADAGGGKILSNVIAAIELKVSNLLKWQGRWGETSKPHYALCMALHDPTTLKQHEDLLYRLYCSESDKIVFDDLVKLIGQKYPLISYLFFLKDRSRYMPLAPTYFDRAFEMLGVVFSTSKKCSWQNYSIYNSLLLQVRSLLSEKLNDVSLLDAHSFAWMLSTKLANDSEPAEIIEYKALGEKERQAIIRARIGQGFFRRLLIEYWGGCAVTACAEQLLLKASHIKPWAVCDVREALNPYNGLLLSPSLDAAFDAGLISFADSGEILISPKLTAHDGEILGIDSSLRLTRVDGRHHQYLNYHRTYRFKKE